MHGKREGDRAAERELLVLKCATAHEFWILFLFARGDSSTLLNVVEMAAIIWNAVANFQLKWCNKWNPSTSTKNEARKNLWKFGACALRMHARANARPLSPNSFMQIYEYLLNKNVGTFVAQLTRKRNFGFYSALWIITLTLATTMANDDGYQNPLESK